MADAYETPEFEVVTFGSEDVLTASSEGDNWGGEIGVDDGSFGPLV